MPVDIYVGGMEHAIMHLLYARFFHKFLCDEFGISGTKDGHDLREPFKELIVQGLVKGKTFQKASGEYISTSEVTDEEGLIVTFEKMSKSKGNGVEPGQMAQIYGVDSLRLAVMFGAPAEADLNFDESLLKAMKSFLDRVERFKDHSSATDVDLSKVAKLLIECEQKIE